jgi:cytochrome b subunit of formate dehydrogenase
MNSPEVKRGYLVRLTSSQIKQHMVMAVSTTLLVITGFMLYADDWFIAIFGQLSNTLFWWRGWIHRIAGIAVGLVCAYHLVYVAVTIEGRSWFMDMLPKMKDFFDLYQNMMYLLDLSEYKPKIDRFMYLEKLEYWSVYFGMIIVISTGIIMWTEYLWPKFYLDVALAFHIGEATLAALAIIAGHLSFVLYHPHTYPAAKTVVNGLISVEQAKDEYEGWYEKEMARLATEEVGSEVVGSEVDAQ